MTDARDIVERLREVCTDWDGSQMKDAEEPRAWLSVGEIREAANEIASLRKQLEDAHSGMENIASDLLDQKEEPWPEQEARRVHYWRDKAIKAGNELRALKGQA